MDKLEKMWSSLEDDLKKNSSSSLLKRRLSSTSSDDIFLLAERNQLNSIVYRGVSFGVLNNAAEINEILPAHQQLRLYINKLDENKPFLTIMLNDIKFNDVFTNLSNDLIHYISSRTATADIGSAALNRLSKWKYFLENCSPEGLPSHLHRGLLGELLFLKDFLLPYLVHADAVNAWTGPDRKAKDFIFNNGAVEVKTTATKRHKKITIANENQLDPEGYSFLYLWHVGLDEAADSDISLPDTVNMIRNIIEQEIEITAVFECKLLNYGYLDIHADKYKTLYTIKEKDFFEVSEEFPKITGKMLPDGVGDVSYSVIISDCGKFKKSDTVVMKNTGLAEHE